MSRRELLIGAGNSRIKRIHFPEIPEKFEGLTTLDMASDCGADVVHDLDVLPYPFADDEFDEIHAYDVLEHCGRQGDWAYFFAQFAEFHRILKPNGYLCATVPAWDSPWAWGDPGHTRVITLGSLSFLDQAHYEQIGRTGSTDYRHAWRGNFRGIAANESEHQLGFVLQAIK